MFIRIAFLILSLTANIAFSQETGENKLAPNVQVFLIGSIHSMHFIPDNHYSLIDLLDQINALQPDLVCGEISPEAFNKEMEGYFPPEAALLAQMASSLNYRFAPVDWRLDYATQSIASEVYPNSVKEQISPLIEDYKKRLQESTCKSAYDFLHNEVNIAIIDSIFEQIIGTNAMAEIAHGSWRERNRRIVENGLAAAGNARKIVFVFGSDHLPQIQRQLKYQGINAIIPQRLFSPKNEMKVSPEVILRWKRNLENLKKISNKQIYTSEDNYNKVINSKRIRDLEEAIEKSK